MKPEIKEYLASIGSKGGKKTSPAKKAAAAANIKARWANRTHNGRGKSKNEGRKG